MEVSEAIKEIIELTSKLDRRDRETLILWFYKTQQEIANLKMELAILAIKSQEQPPSLEMPILVEKSE